jgi:hypothetical protein
MTYLPPFLVQGTHQLEAEQIRAYAADYRRVLEALLDGRIDADEIQDLGSINGDLEAVTGRGNG